MDTVDTNGGSDGIGNGTCVGTCSLQTLEQLRDGLDEDYGFYSALAV